MLSPLLEQLVLTGQATVKTHNHGIGGVGSIQVPAGKKIIVVQIIWHPFIDVNDMVALKGALLGYSGSFLHTLKLRNKSSRYAFTFRDTINSALANSRVVGDKTLEVGVVPAAPHIIDTYLPFMEGSIDIDIMKFTDFSGWQIHQGYMSGKTNEAEPGEGYGNTNSVNKFQTVIGNHYAAVNPPWLPWVYSPPTTIRTGTGSGGAETDEFEGNYPLTMPPTVVAGGPKDSDVSMFPVVTFTYVEINNRYVPGQIGKVNTQKI